MIDAIRLERVTVRRGGVTILEDVTAAVPARSVTAIIGPNGAGKTTLLYAILGLVPAQGRISLHSSKGRGRPKIGYVSQRLDFDRGSPISVLDFLSMGHQRLPVWLGITRRSRERAKASLARTAAEHLMHKPLGKLSGGELQRVQLALALQHDAEILLLDEPVAGVDVSGERLFCDMIEQVQRESKLTVVMVSHDLSVVSRHATHVICLKGTVQCQGRTPEVLTAENLASIYGPHMGLYRHDCPGEGHTHDHAHQLQCEHSLPIVKEIHGPARQ